MSPKGETVHPLYRSPTRGRTHRQRGMSLAEILVSLAIFVIAISVALILYNSLANSYKRGDNAVDQQQNTRHADRKSVV